MNGTDRREHDWVRLALGRACIKCKVVQPWDEFDDTEACHGPSYEETPQPRRPDLFVQDPPRARKS
jgi:hypothetical protein